MGGFEPTTFCSESDNTNHCATEAAKQIGHHSLGEDVKTAVHICSPQAICATDQNFKVQIVSEGGEGAFSPPGCLVAVL